MTRTALLGATMIGLGGVASAQSMDIVGTAAGAGNFTTLVAAVEAAGLAETLMGPGPYTVFAPSDEAFAMVPAESLASMMTADGIPQLQTLLLAHVSPVVMTASDFEQAFVAGEWPNVADVNTTVMTVGNTPVVETDSMTEVSKLYISKSGNAIYVSSNENTMDQARIIQADIMATNGVIHVIDHVLNPDG